MRSIKLKKYSMSKKKLAFISFLVLALVLKSDKAN